MTENLNPTRGATDVRFVALGDSATCGLGDTVEGHLRGWSRILIGALRESYRVSYCNLAVPGSTIEDVWCSQLPEALTHSPHLVSVVVGLNDTFRADWDAALARQHLRAIAGRLHQSGAELLTLSFHDHTKVFGLRGFLARRLSRRIDELNAIYDEIHRDFDTVHVDLRDEPVVYLRDYWTIDRLHPSAQGHRLLALRFAQGLEERGATITTPLLTQDGDVLSRAEEVRNLIATGVPWLYRRVRDWSPRLVLNVLPARLREAQ